MIKTMRQKYSVCITIGTLKPFDTSETANGIARSGCVQCKGKVYCEEEGQRSWRIAGLEYTGRVVEELWRCEREVQMMMKTMGDEKGVKGIEGRKDGDGDGDEKIIEIVEVQEGAKAVEAEGGKELGVDVRGKEERNETEVEGQKAGGSVQIQVDEEQSIAGLGEEQL